MEARYLVTPLRGVTLPLQAKEQTVHRTSLTMTTATVTALLLCCADTSRAATAREGLGRLTERWHVGDTWVVRRVEGGIGEDRQTGELTDYPMAAIAYSRMEVIAEEVVRGELCFKVSCTQYQPSMRKDLPDEGWTIACYMKEAGTLIRVEEFSSIEAFREGGRASVSDISEPAISCYQFPKLGYVYYTACPLMFPDWGSPNASSPQVSDERYVVGNSTGPDGLVKRRIRGWNRQQLAYRTDAEGEYLECRFQKLWQEEADFGTERCNVEVEFVMDLRPNEPWWRKVDYYENGVLFSRGELASYGDTKIALADVPGAAIGISLSELRSQLSPATDTIDVEKPTEEGVLNLSAWVTGVLILIGLSSAAAAIVLLRKNRSR